MIVNINGKNIEVLLIKKNIKGTYLRLKNSKQVVITSRHHFTDLEIKKFIDKHKKWLITKLDNLIDLQFEENEVMFFGKKYKIINDKSQKAAFKFKDQILIINDSKSIKKVYEYGYEILKKEFNKIINNINFKKKPVVQLRKMKSRWGVCHYQQSKIVLNKFLIFLPIHLVHYVIYHEITHLYYPNHSKDFYQKLLEFIPKYPEYRKELRKYCINY